MGAPIGSVWVSSSWAECWAAGSWADQRPPSPLPPATWGVGPDLLDQLLAAVVRRQRVTAATLTVPPLGLPTARFM